MFLGNIACHLRRLLPSFFFVALSLYLGTVVAAAADCYVQCNFSSFTLAVSSLRK
jgi:hypothetical protein